MAQKKNKNKQSGQLARQSQNNISNSVGKPAPVASAKTVRVQAPNIQNGQNCVRISHKELVASVSGNTTFGVDSYSLNPGVSATFPWLSTVATSYEQYKFNKLKFHYVTRAPTSYIGSILLAPEYDALDSAPTTEIDAAMMNGAVEDAPWKDITLTYMIKDLFPMGPRLFIRGDTAVSGSDLKTYDCGQLFVCKSLCADTSAIGRLWVEYDIELHIPQNPSSSGTPYSAVGSAVYSLITSDQNFTSTTAANIAWNSEVLDSIGISNSSGSLTLPSGNYLATAMVSVNDVAHEIFTIQIAGHKNGIAMSPAYQSKVIKAAPSTGSTTGQIYLQFPFSSSGSDTLEVSLTLTGSSTLTAVHDQCTLSIIRLV